MRIIYFSHLDTPHDLRFLEALAQTPYRVFALTLTRGGGRPRQNISLPEGIERLEWSGDRKLARGESDANLLDELRTLVDHVKPDLIHAGPIQSAAFLAAQAGFRPLVSMSWGSDLLVDADRSADLLRITRYTLERSDVLLGDCQAVKQKAVSLGFPAERVVLFPWGVDLERFSPGDEKALRLFLGGEASFVLLSLRAWEPLYGVDIIARAFVRAAQQRPDLRLVLMGGGSQEGLLRSLLEAGGVIDRVIFPGQVSQAELPAYYRAADLYVSASHSDGSSVSLLEALACGLPALVSDIPGNREWISPEEQGWLFPDGNAEALAAAILRTAGERERLPEYSLKARQLAVKRADWTVNFKTLLKGYDLAVNG
ncbi:MAG: glycosyltransferase [Chloroflexi bacterium]|nr:glycosyltransferase [Chloroflexota bacterium]